MKPLELKAARVRLGYSQQDIADLLEISIHSYHKKERGEVKFSDTEKIQVAKILGFTLEQLNYILYDGILPISNADQA